MRDRLIEIFQKTNYQNRPDGLTANFATQFSEYALREIVDALLANGVIVPPVKVGQTVYVMESENTGYFECEIVSMQYDGVQWLGCMNCLWVHHHGGFWKWQECDIGKTVFLTREQAEKALAEVANDA